MDICSETDPELDVLKPYCQRTFDIYDKIENYIIIQIMTYIRILLNMPQQLQQPGIVNCSHEHFSLNRLEASNT